MTDEVIRVHRDFQRTAAGARPSVLTIKEATQRAKEEGIPISEYGLRCLVKAGKIPVRRIGPKTLLFYPNLVRYLRCDDGADNTPDVTVSFGVRRVDA